MRTQQDLVRRQDDDGTRRHRSHASATVERPVVAMLAPGDVLTMQRMAGNRAVVQRAPAREKPVAPPPGPYTGRRRRNDPMDRFESNQHLFKPAIFFAYGPYPELWSPLRRVVDAFYVRHQENPRLTDDERLNAWVVIERFNPRKAAFIRANTRGRWREGALVDALWGELGKQYTFSLRTCRREYRASNFRLEHEWMAVRFGRVTPPFAYWARSA